jgi:hypothetical protein
MQFEAKLTLDGLMTLVAGVIAFVAVIIQVRSSSKQLHDQMKAQRDAERQEQDRQKKAVATALLFEIDGFYAAYLRQLRDLLEGKEIRRDTLPHIMSLPPDMFPVFNGNADRIGELPTDCVLAIVGFFREAGRIVSTFNDYESSLERADQIQSRILNAADIPSQRARDNQVRLAFTQLALIKKGLPEVISLTYLVCETLCKITGVPFEYPTITVADEDLSADRIAEILPDIDPEEDDSEGKQVGNS